MISLLLVTFQHSSHGEERPLPTTHKLLCNKVNTLRKALKHLKRSSATDFEYVDRGTVCSLGAHDGVGIVYGRDITGKKHS